MTASTRPSSAPGRRSACRCKRITTELSAFVDFRISVEFQVHSRLRIRMHSSNARSSADPGADRVSGLRVAARGPPGSARRRTATSAAKLPLISKAVLRASPKPGCRSRGVIRSRLEACTAGCRRAAPDTRPAGHLRQCVRWSVRYRKTASGAVAPVRQTSSAYSATQARVPALAKATGASSDAVKRPGGRASGQHRRRPAGAAGTRDERAPGSHGSAST
jgi:hypothetical protein